MAKKRDTPTNKAATEAARLLGCVRECGKYSPTAAMLLIAEAMRILKEDGVRKPEEWILPLYERREPCLKNR